MSGFPVLVEGTRVEALVVGGGSVADRKVAALLESGCRVRVVAPDVCGALQARAAASPPQLTIAARPYDPADIGGAQLVIAATDARAINARVAADAHRLGRLVNVVDVPDEGSFVTLAVHRAEPIVIGVSAGGVPRAAARIRDAIATRFDKRFQSAITALSGVRRRLLDDRDSNRWAAIERDVVDAHFCERVEQGTFGARLAEHERRAAAGSVDAP